MKKDKNSQIKRILGLEYAVMKLNKKYPEIVTASVSDKLKFYLEKITIEEKMDLDIFDMEYLNYVSSIPFLEIERDLIRYDNSSPKLDELKFVANLMDKYSVDRATIITRIRQIRRINKYIKDKKLVLEIDEEQADIVAGVDCVDEETKKRRFVVMACPVRRPFVVATDKVEAFLNASNSKQNSEQVSEMSETFRKNNLLFEYQYPEFKAMEHLREDIINNPQKYAGCDIRIRLGLFRTPEEQEQYIEEGLSRPLPSEPKVRKRGSKKK